MTGVGLGHEMSTKQYRYACENTSLVLVSVLDVKLLYMPFLEKSHCSV